MPGAFVVNFFIICFCFNEAWIMAVSQDFFITFPILFFRMVDQAKVSLLCFPILIFCVNSLSIE